MGTAVATETPALRRANVTQVGKEMTVGFPCVTVTRKEMCVAATAYAKRGMGRQPMIVFATYPSSTVPWERVIKTSVLDSAAVTECVSSTPRANAMRTGPETTAPSARLQRLRLPPSPPHLSCPLCPPPALVGVQTLPQGGLSMSMAPRPRQHRFQQWCRLIRTQ